MPGFKDILTWMIPNCSCSVTEPGQTNDTKRNKI